MNESPIALVSTLRETSVIFAAGIGALALKEPFGRTRVLAAVLVAAGAACIRWG